MKIKSLLCFILWCALIIAPYAWLSDETVHFVWNNYSLQTTLWFLWSAFFFFWSLSFLILWGMSRSIASIKLWFARDLYQDIVTLFQKAEEEQHVISQDTLWQYKGLARLLVLLTQTRLQDHPQEEQQIIESIRRLPEGEFFAIKYDITQALKNNKTNLCEPFQQWLQTHPSPWSLRILTDYFLEKKDLEKAALWIPLLKRNAPDLYPSRQAKLWLLKAQDVIRTDLPLAESLLYKAHRTYPQSTDVTCTYATLLFQQEKQRQAVKFLKATWSLNPHPKILEALRQNNESALQYFERLQDFTASAPHHPLTHWALAQGAIAAELWTRAHMHTDALEAHQPQWATYLRAQLAWREEGAFQTAFECLEEAFVLHLCPKPLSIMRRVNTLYAHT